MISQCAFCNGDIEYGEEYAGKWTECPHCAKKTPLARPQISKPAEPKKWKHRIRILACVVFGPILIIPIAFALLRMISPSFDDTLPMKIAALAITILASIIALAWLFFPLIVWYGFKDLLREQRKTNELLGKQ